jgi:L-ascorbate metabolism protein UlaG (beta-lactamase superfamily)
MAALTATFAGVATVLVSDGRSSILIDGFFTRPGLLRTAAGRVHPDRALIAAALDRLGVQRLDAVLVSHSHLDHVLDSPIVAAMTGAALAGSGSTRNIQIGYGLADEPFVELAAGEPVRFGGFEVTPVRAQHSEGDSAPGVIDAPLVPPARTRDYRTGECYTFRIAHEGGAVTVHGTANFIEGALDSTPTDLLYLGAGGAGKKSSHWREQYWAETVTATGARSVRPVHWDAFWRPLTQPLRPLPRALDRLDVTMADFARFARRDGVELALPVLWEPTLLRPAP